MFVYTYLRRTDPVGYPKSRLLQMSTPWFTEALAANRKEVSPTQPEFLMATYHSNMLI